MTRGEMGTRGTPEQRAEEAREAARIMRLDVRLNLEQPDGHVFVTDEARTRAGARHTRLQTESHLHLALGRPAPRPRGDRAARARGGAPRLDAPLRRGGGAAGACRCPRSRTRSTRGSSRPPSSWTFRSTSRTSCAPSSLTARSSTTRTRRSPITRISEEGFLKQLESRWRYYGSLINVAAGEAYYVREALNVEDPVALLTRPMNIYS